MERLVVFAPEEVQSCLGLGEYNHRFFSGDGRSFLPRGRGRCLPGRDHRMAGR